MALRLEVGPGGSGKTRLMIEAARVLTAEHGWESFVYSSAPDALAKFEVLRRSGKNCFVVVDYAETRPSDVVDLARAALSGPRAGKVRLALLARNAGAWWERLADGTDGDLKLVLESPSSKTGPYRIDEERVSLDLRPQVFGDALKAFATKKGLPTPEGTIPDLASEHFGEVLFIHLAALAKLRGQGPNDDKALIDHALGHERAYWRRMLGECGIKEARLDDLGQVVAHLTLIGGTRTAKESREVIEKTPRLKGVPGELVQAIFDLLRRMYQNHGGISGLLPDLLGERLVALALDQDDGLLDIALGAEASSETARQSLTVLARIAQRFPEEGRWLAGALAGC